MKICITKETEEILERMIKRVNEGFKGGRVTGTELISWVISYFEKEGFESCIERIRSENFDSMTYLLSVVKEARRLKKTGVESIDFADLLAPIVQRPRRRRTAEPEANG